MPILERETIVTPVRVEDTSNGTLFGVILGLMIVAFVCYFAFFNPGRVVERTTTNTITPSMPTTMPAPTVMPSSPTNTTINVPAPAAPAAAAPAAAPEDTASQPQPAATIETNTNTTTTNAQ
jgi:hypothetical protein